MSKYLRAPAAANIIKIRFVHSMLKVGFSFGCLLAEVRPGLKLLGYQTVKEQDHLNKTIKLAE